MVIHSPSAFRNNRICRVWQNRWFQRCFVKIKNHCHITMKTCDTWQLFQTQSLWRALPHALCPCLWPAWNPRKRGSWLWRGLNAFRMVAEPSTVCQIRRNFWSKILSSYWLNGPDLYFDPFSDCTLSGTLQTLNKFETFWGTRNMVYFISITCSKKFQFYIPSNVLKIMSCQFHANRRHLWSFPFCRTILDF